MFSGVGIALPMMGRELQASGVQLGLIEIVYLGAVSAFLLPIGRLADLTDRNRIFKVGLFVYTFTTLILGFIDSIPLFITIRFIQGFAAALTMATNMAILTDNVPRAKLGKAIGLNIGAVYLGLSAGPFVAGWITTNLGWRWVFFITFIPLLLSFSLILFTIQSKWKWLQVKFDWIGSGLISMAVFLLIAGAALLRDPVVGFSLCFAGLLVTAVFFMIESRMKAPLLSMTAIRQNKSLSIALVIQLLMYAGAFGLSFLLSIYLQIIKGFTPQFSGQILILSPIVMAVFAPICGRLADRYSPKILASIGLVLGFLSSLGATQIASETSLLYVSGVLILQGLGFAIFSSPNMAIIMNSVEPSQYGFASALAAKLRSLGMVASMLIITIFMSIFLGKQMVDTQPVEYLSVMQLSFAVFTVSAFIGTVLSFKTPKEG